MSTVTFRHIGRLGNAMFQCAAAIGYAKKYNIKWVCPSNTGEVPRFHEYFPNLPVQDFYGGIRYEAHDPTMFKYNDIPYFENGVQLLGFFQSEKYFKHAETEVREIFKLKEYPELKDYVSIHIRRGDYVLHSNSFPPITMEYIAKALYHIGHEKVYLFSDDIDWCQKNVIRQFGQFEWQISRGHNEFEDLSMMASCSHNIIANSTFSWWSAWLNRNPDKIVVSPSRFNWFGPGNSLADTSDLIPNGWKQIEYLNIY